MFTRTTVAAAVGFVSLFALGVSSADAGNRYRRPYGGYPNYRPYPAYRAYPAYPSYPIAYPPPVYYAPQVYSAPCYYPRPVIAAPGYPGCGYGYPAAYPTPYPYYRGRGNYGRAWSVGFNAGDSYYGNGFGVGFSYASGR